MQVRAVLWTSAGTTWTRRAGLEANVGSPGARVWCCHTFWRQQATAPLCSAPTVDDSAGSEEPRPTDCCSSWLWRWQMLTAAFAASIGTACKHKFALYHFSQNCSLLFIRHSCWKHQLTNWLMCVSPVKGKGPPSTCCSG